jgi:hypothetical protein
MVNNPPVTNSKAKDPMCGNCFYARPAHDPDDIKCCRTPPTDGFPTMDVEQWCGEWKSKYV